MEWVQTERGKWEEREMEKWEVKHKLRTRHQNQRACLCVCVFGSFPHVRITKDHEIRTCQHYALCMHLHALF